MDINTYIFLLIVVGGVTLIWSFRIFAGRKRTLGEIEYLAFACIWGIVLVAIHAQIMKYNHSEELTRLLSNPFASAVFFALMGLMFGGFSGYLDKKYDLTSKLQRLIP
jgi:hypothetical protein